MGRRKDAHHTRWRAEEGFTLVELMVVVLILSILLVIGVPSILGARQRAQHSAAKANVRQALSAQLVFYANDSEFSGDNTAGGDLDAIAPELVWGTLDAKDRGVVASVTGPGNNTAILRSRSTPGTVFCLGRVASGVEAGTYFTTGCDGTEDLATVTTWPSTVSAGWI